MAAGRALGLLALGLAALAATASATKCIHFKYADRCDLKQIIKTYKNTGEMANAQVLHTHRLFGRGEFMGRTTVEQAHMVMRPDLAPAGSVRTAVYVPSVGRCMDQLDPVPDNDVMCFEFGEHAHFSGRECTKYYNTTDMAYYVTSDNEMIGFSTPEGYATVAYDATVKFTREYFVETFKGCKPDFAVPPPKDVFDAACHNFTASSSRILAGPMRVLWGINLLKN